MLSHATVGLLVLLSQSGQPERRHHANVVGVVRVEGTPPPAKVWELDEVMIKHLGEKTYRDETWLVSRNQGLANCVITLEPVDRAERVAVQSLRNIVLDKEGVRFSPRVLVVTPGTEVTFRNRASPCRGFRTLGNPDLDHIFNVLVREGTETKSVVKGVDTLSVSCPVRPYTQGWIKVVATPWSAVTDADGAFTIKNVPEGKYKIAVWHEAAGKRTEYSGPRAVQIKAGGDMTLEFRVKTTNQRD